MSRGVVMIAVIETLEITEKLSVRIDGKSYFIKVDYTEAIFKGNKISKEELTELKKLPSHLRDNLFVKYKLSGIIKTVEGNPQSAFDI